MNNFDLGKEITRGVESVGRAVQSIGSSIVRGIDEVFNPGGAEGGANRSNNERGTAGASDSGPISGVNGLAPRAESLRAQGNEALKTGHLAHALNLYTQAINVQQRVDHRMKGQSRFCALFSNRSAVFMQLRQYENALEDACRCLELNSTWPKGYSRKGAALVALGQHKEAIRVLERGLQLDPDNAAMKHSLNRATVLMQLSDPGTPADKVLLLKSHGNKSLAAGQPHDALNYYTQAIACNAAIEKDASSKNGGEASASAPASSGGPAAAPQDPASATTATSTTSTTSSTTTAALGTQAHTLYSNRSAVFMQLRQYENALADANECLKRAPQWPKAYSRVGAALVALGRYSAAQRVLKRGLELEPGNVAMKNMLHKAQNTVEVTVQDKVKALKESGNAALKKGGLMEALDYYTQALNLEEHSTLYSNRSAVNMQLKRYGAALADANHCLRLAPEWPKSYSRVSAALLALGRPASAVNFLEKGLQLEPQNAAMAKMLAQARESQNASTDGEGNNNAAGGPSTASSTPSDIMPPPIDSDDDISPRAAGGGGEGLSSGNTSRPFSPPLADLDEDEWQIDGDDDHKSATVVGQTRGGEQQLRSSQDVDEPLGATGVEQVQSNNLVQELSNSPGEDLPHVAVSGEPEEEQEPLRPANGLSSPATETAEADIKSVSTVDAAAAAAAAEPTATASPPATTADTTKFGIENLPASTTSVAPTADSGAAAADPADRADPAAAGSPRSNEEIFAADPTMRRLDDISPLLHSIRFELSDVRVRLESGKLPLNTLSGRGALRKALGDLHGQARHILHTQIDTLSTGHLADNDEVRKRVQLARRELAVEGMQLIQDIEDTNAKVQKMAQAIPLEPEPEPEPKASSDTNDQDTPSKKRKQLSEKQVQLMEKLRQSRKVKKKSKSPK